VKYIFRKRVRCIYIWNVNYVLYCLSWRAGIIEKKTLSLVIVSSFSDKMFTNCIVFYFFNRKNSYLYFFNSISNFENEVISYCNSLLYHCEFNCVKLMRISKCYSHLSDTVFFESKMDFHFQKKKY